MQGSIRCFQIGERRIALFVSFGPMKPFRFRRGTLRGCQAPQALVRWSVSASSLSVTREVPTTTDS